MTIVKAHLSLNLSNSDASVACYEKAFGVHASERRPVCCAPEQAPLSLAKKRECC
jgi:hypothetical protein